LTGVYKPHEYGKIILPLTVIRRFDCILADTKDAVVKKFNEVKSLPMQDVLLRKAAGNRAFYNVSKFTFADYVIVNNYPDVNMSLHAVQDGIYFWDKLRFKYVDGLDSVMIRNGEDIKCEK
jgi:type I restriction-modification system DNA methylase subunit